VKRSTGYRLNWERRLAVVLFLGAVVAAGYGLDSLSVVLLVFGGVALVDAYQKHRRTRHL